MEKKPITKEDLLMLIKRNGGSAEGLDLLEYRFQDEVDLSNLDLSGIKLKKAQLFRANFNGSNLDRALLRGANLGYATFNPIAAKVASLQGVDMRGANLDYAEFQKANLSGAQFQGDLPHEQSASLTNTDFRESNLFRANFNGCYFYGTKFEGSFIRGTDITEARMGDADWGNYFIGEEKAGDFYSAEHRYRHLKAWYKNSGYDHIAARFYYREKEAGRKGSIRKRDRIAGWFIWAYFGHGEAWKRIFIWILALLFFFSGINFVIGTKWPGCGSINADNYWDYLYFSFVSFTAVGYGAWITTATGVIKWLGVIETFIGNFMLASVLVTFIRKWTH